MSERNIEMNAVRHAMRNGWFVCKLNSVSCNGIPDRMFIKGGRVVFIEFKATGKTTRKLQDIVIGDMQAHGAEVHVIDNLDEAYNVLS
ncbi:MAG: VRR-NUC domain-containing protein [Gammaproteobacteria bacterium]|nr:VRR-NUC domain-containing protein [Gammaproteobacteria bacterium]